MKPADENGIIVVGASCASDGGQVILASDFGKTLTVSS
jgi:hypothetical protein